jgi:Tesmin/TSO1-like CXC domain, cysteine-rich domain
MCEPVTFSFSNLTSFLFLVLKYCECFAANVKCSSSCRCMGCKNMGGPSADYRDHQAAMGMMAAVAAHHAMQYHRSQQRMGSSNPGMRQFGVVNGNNNIGLPSRQLQMQADVSRSSSASNDPWMAAQSLTYLKRGSPGNHGAAAAHQSNEPYSMGVSPITKFSGTVESSQENVSMPSLSSSSEGTSPGDCAVLTSHLKAISTPESFKGETNALLLAAVAMTEFGQSPPPTSSMLSTDLIRPYTTSRDPESDSMENNSTPGTRGDIPSSKRSINFDDLPDGDGNDVTKKIKPAVWM